MSGNYFSREYLKLYICLILSLLILLVYWQIQYFDFIIYDDPNYVQDNEQVKQGLTWAGILWSFSTTHAANWHPLTWLSLMLDTHIFGVQSGGYHWTNVMFHLVNSLLLFLIFNRMTGSIWRTGFVAAIFALHPLHVESVAWITERKDVLSTFFGFLTIGAYIYYTEEPNVRRFLMILLFFALGLLAKPMLVTIPFLLLLLDYWPLARYKSGKMTGYGESRKNTMGNNGVPPLISHPMLGWKWLLVEKTPLFMMSIVSGIITLYAQRTGGALATLEKFSLADRLANALVSYAAYLGKMVFPCGLALLYPHPHTWPLAKVFLSGFTLLLITMLVWRRNNSRGYLKVGWLWYLVTLLPVIGILQVGNQAMADRYTYIPLIGPSLIIAWEAAAQFNNWRYGKCVLSSIAAVIIIILSLLTFRQVGLWQNTETILNNSIINTNGNHEAFNNLGVFLMIKGQYKQAIAYLENCLSINPEFAVAYNNLGQAYIRTGNYEKGIAILERGLQINPGLIKARRNLANIMLLKENYLGAATHYRLLIQANQGDADMFNDLGVALARLGKEKEAMANFRRALAMNPQHREAMMNMRLLLNHAGGANRVP